MNRRFPRYPDDADYQTNAPSYYEDLARKQKLIQLLAEKIWEYENTLNETLEEIEKRLTAYILENDSLMKERLENWDKRIEEMPEEMRSLFIVWLEDGTLEQIINHDVLGNKADQSELDKTNMQLSHIGGIHLGFEPFKINSSEEITETVNRAIEHAYKNDIPKVIFPEGHYYVDVVEGIRVKNNVDIVFEGNSTVIEALKTSEQRYAIFKVWNVNNVGFYGKATLIGERDSHTGTDGEYGYGIDIKGSNDIFIDHIVAKDFWGDGMFIGTHEDLWVDGTGNPYIPVSKNIHIKYFEADNNRRQGISVISVDGLYAKKLVLKNTNGTPPQAGIDFEPNTDDEFLKNIVIDELITDGNLGSGLEINIMQWGKTKEHEVSILIRKHIDKSRSRGIGYFSNGSENVKGYLTINDVEYHNTQILIRDHPAESLKITFKDPVIYSDGTFTPYTFTKIETVTHKPYIMGNVEFTRPQVIYTTEKKSTYEMVFRNGNADGVEPGEFGLKNVSIINPRSGVRNISVQSRTENLTIIDEYNSLRTYGLVDSFVESPFITKKIYERLESVSDIRFTFNPNLYGRQTTFVNKTGEEFRLIPPAGGEFLPKPLDWEQGERLYSTHKGDRITIDHRKNGELYIIEQVGNWKFIS